MILLSRAFLPSFTLLSLPKYLTPPVPFLLPSFTYPSTFPAFVLSFPFPMHTNSLRSLFHHSFSFLSLTLSWLLFFIALSFSFQLTPRVRTMFFFSSLRSSTHLCSRLIILAPANPPHNTSPPKPSPPHRVVSCMRWGRMCALIRTLHTTKTKIKSSYPLL